MLKRLSLGTKLTGGFILIALITLVVGLIGFRGLTQAQKAQKEMAGVRLPATNGLWKMYMNFEQVVKAERSALLIQANPKEVEHQQMRVKEYFGYAEDGFKIFDTLPRDPEEESIWSEIKQSWEAWKREQAKVMTALGSGSAKEKEDAYAIALSTSRDAYRKVEILLEKLVGINTTASEKVGRQFEKDAFATKIFSLVSVLVGVVMALILGIFLSITISRSLNKMTAFLSEGAEQVSLAADQLSTSSQSLAEGASEQAASLEQTSSAMEEMSAMTKRNTESAGQAKMLTESAGVAVEKANGSMGQLVGQMAEISSMGSEIAKIIKTIDEIAFQTNLLALNAAVEAARAGEAGAGFAVVADEVRNLALRAADAARNTSGLIEGAIKKIKDGTELVERTNVDFSEVMDSVGKVRDLAGEVAVASEEQSRGIVEVSSAVSEMDKLTQANAAFAEQIASASEELNAQAMSLQEVILDLHSLVKGNGATRTGIAVQIISAGTFHKVQSDRKRNIELPHNPVVKWSESKETRDYPMKKP